MSRDKTRLYIFNLNFICFQQKEPIKSPIFGTFMASFRPRKYKVSAKKKYRRVTLMTLKNDAKFKEIMTCSFKYGMGNFVNFRLTTQKSKHFILLGYFCPKYMRFELKKYRRVIFQGNEQWWKLWINPDLVVSKMGNYLRNWVNFH